MSWAKGKTILIVEDDGILALAESNMLRARGFVVVTASGVESALEQIRLNQSIDLVLMDINLGETVDGIALAKSILSIRDVPLMFLSNHTDSEVVERAGTVTSYGYIVKDSGETVLLNALKTAFLLHNVHCQLMERERALAESGQLLAATLRSIGDGVVSTDRDGAVVDMNVAAETLTGWKIAEARGRPIEEIFNIVDRHTLEKLENPVARVIREGTVVELANHTVLVARDGVRRHIADSGAPIRNVDGSIIGVVFVFRDVTEEKRLQAEIDRNAQWLQAFFDNTHIGIYRSTPDGRILMVNPALLAMLRYDSFATLAKRNLEKEGFEPSYERSTFKRLMERDGKVVGHESQWKRSDGTYLWVRESAVAVHDEQGAITWYDGTVEDSTEFHRTEEALRQSEERYRLMTENSYDAIWQVDLDLRITYISKADERIRGIDRNAVLGKPLSSLFSPVGAARLDLLLALLRGSHIPAEPVQFESEAWAKNNTLVWVEVTVNEMHDADGVLIGYHGVIRDISERKKSEDALTRAFEERDALYRELQHRVKNSMAMIASLVGLEANRSEDNATRASLENIRDRVNSLAALYDILREAGNGNDVHLDEYLKKLVGSLEHAYLQEKSEVVLQVKADPVMLDARRAASFGLIVNELVTNSLKHGVKQGEAGIIRVELRLLCDEIALDVTDTGKGLPSGFDVTQAKGLGLQLVLMLVEQLGGFVTCETAEEARFHVRLPLNG